MIDKTSIDNSAEDLIRGKLGDRFDNVSLNDIVKAKDFTLIRKGTNNLVINGDTGAWAILDNNSFQVFAKMQNLSVSKLFEDVNVRSAELISFIRSLYDFGLVSINGRWKRLTSNKPSDLSLALLVLKLTNRCNLLCKYCYNEGLDSADGGISIDIALKSIKNALEACNKGVDIILHGGEPLLQFDLIRKIVEYGEMEATEHSKEIRFSMQTNATLLNETNIKFIKEHDIGLGVSFDGPGYLNDEVRVYKNGNGSSSEIMHGLRLLQSHGLSIHIITVITKYNARRLADVVLHLQKMGCRSVKFSSFFPQGLGSASLDLSPDPQDIVYSLKTIIEKIISGEISTIEVDDIMMYMDNVLLHNKSNICHRSPCGAGKDMMTVFPSGKIYSCDCLVHPDFELGNIKNSSFKEASLNIKNLRLGQRIVDNLVPCSSCCMRQSCGGSMTCRAFWKNGNVNSIDPSECFINQSIIEELMWNLTEYPTLVNYYKKFKEAKLTTPGTQNDRVSQYRDIG